MEKFYVSDKDAVSCFNSSKGCQLKWKKNKVWLKADSRNETQALSEYLCSGIFECIKSINYVPYSLCDIIENGKAYRGCYSLDYKKEEEDEITFRKLVDMKYGNPNNLKRLTVSCSLEEKFYILIDLAGELTGIDFSEELGHKLLVDELVWNNDDHLGNISVTCSKNGYFFTPMLDYGSALLSGCDIIEPQTILEVKSKTLTSSFALQSKTVLDIGISPLKIDFCQLTFFLENNHFDGVYQKKYEKIVPLFLQHIKSLENRTWINASDKVLNNQKDYYVR